MKRRAAYFLLCACFCFSFLSLSSSAVSQDLLDEGYIYDPGTGSYYVPDVAEPEAAASDAESTTQYQGDPEMLEEGWIYDSDTDSYYVPSSPMGWMPSTMLLNDPNHPDFDINVIPFYDAPKYVTDIVYMTLEQSASAVDYSDYKVPFVCVLTDGIRVRVIVGINIALGSYVTQNSSGQAQFSGLYIIASPNFGSYQYSVCYEAYFDYNGNVTRPWTQLPANIVGDPSNYNVVNYTSNIGTAESMYDYYLYGGNGLNVSDIVSGNVPITDGTMYPRFSWVQNKKLGFNSGSYVYGANSILNSYFTTFSPKTSEQAEAETQKGIWETLKSIPEMIGEKLKSLFVPSEGYFDTYTSDFQNYFKDRFGLLYELPEVVISILRDLSQFEPQEGNYSIHFPEVSMPVLDNGEWYDKVIIEERDITFDFLEQGAFKTLYSLYTSVLWLIFIVALINLIIRKADKVFGGSG